MGKGNELQFVGYLLYLAHGGEAGGEEKRATYGWVFLLKGNAISCTSKRCNCITLTTTEFVVTKEATLQAIHLLWFLHEMGVDFKKPTILYV